jgi:hypothetical protein
VSDTLYAASSFSNKERAWDTLIELARALVRLHDEHGGHDCSYISLDVDKGRRVDSSYRKTNIVVRSVSLHFELPDYLADPALARSGAVKLDDKLGEDQALRASLIELD